MLKTTTVGSVRADLSVPTQTDRPTRIARAADGPAPTLVVDLLDATGVEESVAELALRRREAMARDSRLGAKTIGVVGLAGSEIDLLFLQGVGAEVDPISEVCLNSAVVAVEVACVEWGLFPRGRVNVRMGDFTIELEPVVN
ncbi:hypothetical protein HBA53_24550 (plasmid) [Rhodococcus pyridinivorans]|uniref:hypothetical protein n=1 Tax=Rhodococcus pyridinivorans TaxID=103816 RepID=UPI001C30C031|nr:hypothetical protein [Rhodococcus pyridinivorans]QXF84283.1 hypothetical protein HBA53_24550 [Rhodococcus pyridinivorans]